MKNIKVKYDIQQAELAKQCNELVGKHTNDTKKLREINKKCIAAQEKIELNRSDENLQELERIKKEGLGNAVSYDNSIISTLDVETIAEKIPEYPTGINGLRSEIAQNFNTYAVSGNGTIRTEISFVIEKDGSISNVKAFGKNESFNKQAEISLYLTQFQWKPATIVGQPVRYRFKLPLTLNFE